MASTVKRATEFLQESWDELNRVTWPDWQQLRSATLVVIVFCVLVALIIWIMDVVSRTAVDLIMRVFGA